jgi:hypothetical protein
MTPTRSHVFSLLSLGMPHDDPATRIGSSRKRFSGKDELVAAEPIAELLHDRSATAARAPHMRFMEKFSASSQSAFDAPYLGFARWHVARRMRKQWAWT